MITTDIRSASDSLSFVDALFSGLDRGGGLLMPRSWPRLDPDRVEELLSLEFVDRSVRLARLLLEDEFGAGACERIVRDAFDFPLPARAVGDRIGALELFHGPTLAFKDFGARFLARAMAEGRNVRGVSRDPITVLTATSGDTGSAVAQAFFGVEGIQVVILYPSGRVTPLQELQMATLGGNVHALSVAGAFDDCQRLVRGAFEDAGLRRGIGLTTANSMNLGRLIPQVFYYFEAAAAARRLGPSGEIVVSVPSGNFGNLTAGVMAWRMGVPIGRFCAATNRNDTVPRYLESGVYEPRSTVRTHSTAMDVGAPNNWPRIEYLFDGDLEAVRALLRGKRIDDETTLKTIREVADRTGTLLDPHGAVAYAALEAELQPGERGVFLATAHPAKFEAVMRLALGRGVPLPEPLAACLDRPRLDRPLEPSPRALRTFLETALPRLES